MDDAAAVPRPVEREHAAAVRQLGRFPRHLQLLELLQKDVAAPGQRVHANEREIAAIWRNDGENIAEIRGRMCQLASPTILERVQVDRRRWDQWRSDRQRPGACRPASTRARATGPP